MLETWSTAGYVEILFQKGFQGTSFDMRPNTTSLPGCLLCSFRIG